MLYVGRILGGGRPGRHWPVVIIEAGQSLNGVGYTPDLLRESLPLFERAPANAFPLLDAEGNLASFDHVQDDSLVGVGLLNQVGHYEAVRWDESLQAVVGDLVLLEGNEWSDKIQRHFESLESAGRLDTVGLSIDASGPIPAGTTVPTHFDYVTSVDIVSHPAAGGQVGHRIAASRTRRAPTAPSSPWRNPLNWKYKALRAACPRLCEGLSQSDSMRVVASHVARRLKEMGPDDEEAAFVASMLMQDVAAMKAADPAAVAENLETALAVVAATTGAPAGEDDDDDDGDGEDRIEEDLVPGEPDPKKPKRKKESTLVNAQREADEILHNMRRRESRQLLETACAQRKLPEASVKRVLASFDGDATRLYESVATADVDAKAEQEYVDGLIDSSRGGRVVSLRESGDKARDILCAMLSRRFRESEAGKVARGEMRDLNMSLHRYLQAFAGIDVRDGIGGQHERVRMREAVDTTNFNEVFADALHRAALAEYGGLERFQTWRRLATIQSFNDFRTRHFIHTGYYGELPSVAKGAPYLALTTPTDREEQLTLTKFGGVESILWEDLLNDDIGVWQAMLSRIGRASAETVQETVMKVLRTATQPTMADTNKLTATGRAPANQLTVALTKDEAGKTAFLNAVRQMMSQTGGSGKKKGVVPNNIVIPMELADAWAFIRKELVGGLTGLEAREALDVLGAAIPEPLVDFGATDATDWYLHSNEVQNIAVGFLGGREEPETFLADGGNFGAMFTNDRIEVKTRLVVSATALDWVGVQGNVVAG